LTSIASALVRSLLISPTVLIRLLFFFMTFFFSDAPTTEFYTLSLHDALPISAEVDDMAMLRLMARESGTVTLVPSIVVIDELRTDRKSTRLNSSHVKISYAVFCLKKKNIIPSILPIHHSIIPNLLRSMVIIAS